MRKTILFFFLFALVPATGGAKANAISVKVKAASGKDVGPVNIKPSGPGVSLKLDLHGLTENAAHRALCSFLQTAHKRGDRLVRVVTGKGARAPDEPFDLKPRSRGVLKTMVPRWLGEPQFMRLIADTRYAHRRHGGDGALYVYLRKTMG